MLYSALASFLLLFHFAFLAFVVAGALLVLRWPRVAWLHLPAAAWGVLVEFAGLICPLTPLENWLRSRAGEQGYAGGFIAHYLTAAIYPSGLTRPVEVALGTAVLLGNVALYAWVLRRRRRAKPANQLRP